MEQPVRSGPPVVSMIEPGAVERTGDVLCAGGTVVLPTDTVYGLAALPSVPGATAALARLKGRTEQQPLAVLVADVAQALALTGEPSPKVRRWMDEFWPGPLTIVTRRSPEAASLALGGDPATIGVRCPAHSFVREVAARTGPIAATSANLHGEPPASSAVGAFRTLDGDVDLIIDGGPSATMASTVVDVSGERFKVLREGALKVGRLNPT